MGEGAAGITEGEHGSAFTAGLNAPDTLSLTSKGGTEIVTIQRKYGRWLRVEVARHISAGTGEPSEVDDEVLNLDRIVRLYQGPRKKAVFEMQTGEHIFTTEPFEDACVRLMEAETPAITPPLSIRELQNRDLTASEECDPIFVNEKCLYCGVRHDGVYYANHAFVSPGTAHR